MKQRTTFITWVFPNQLKDLQKNKDQNRSRKYFSNEAAHCVANTCIIATVRHLQAPKPKSNQDKRKQRSQHRYCALY